jgi:hypothetical protein
MVHLIDPGVLDNINYHLKDSSANLDFLKLPLEAKVWLNLLKKEAYTKAINLAITEEDFITYFFHKKECMASFPSGRHMGNYITMPKAKDGALT